MIESSTFQSEVTTQLKNILCGIPRGTVIRRLLLFSYINDLPDVPEKIRLCCLPTELTYSGSLFKKLQSDMCKATKWTEENKLTLYKAKTHILFKYKGHSEDAVVFESDILKSSKFANYLGVWLEFELSMKENVSSVRHKWNRFISVVYYVISHLNLILLIKIYKQYIQPLYQ